MTRERVELLGRKAELERLLAVVPGTGPGVLALVSGGAGAGKSALIEAAVRGWQARGLRVLTAGTSAGRGLLDGVLEALREGVAGERDRDLIGLVSAAARLRDRPDADRQALPLAHALAAALAGFGHRGRCVLVLDGVDLPPGDPVTGPTLLVHAARAAGTTVVCPRTPGSGDLGERIAPLAEAVVEVGPLLPDRQRELLDRALDRDGTIDPAVPNEIAAALGPFAGNPAAMLATAGNLREQGRLVEFDQHLCLAGLEPIHLEPDHPLLHGLREEEDPATRLATAVAVLGGIGLNDLPALAEATGIELHRCGQALDRLVADGVLAPDAEGGAGFVVPAVAATLRRRAGADAERELHAGIADALHADGERGQQVDGARLARHLAAAGPDHELPDAVPVLLRAADRMSGTGPDRAADWYRAALDRLPADDPRGPGLLRTLIRLYLAHGRYVELSEVAGRALPGLLAEHTGTAENPDTATHLGLAADVGLAWLIALIHQERFTEISDAAASFHRLAGGSALGGAVVSLCELLVPGHVGAAAQELTRALAAGAADEAGRPATPLVNLGDVAVLITGLVGDREWFTRTWLSWTRSFRDTEATPEAPDQEVFREACVLLDYATAFDLVLGSRYGLGEGGALAAYRSVLRAYFGGEWDTALSLARNLETRQPGNDSSVLRQLVKSIAAEICSARGESERAWAWVASVSEEELCGYLPSWVRCGLLHRSGHQAEAAELGWRQYSRHRELGYLAGLERLLSRLIDHAVRDGDPARARTLLTELESLDALVGSRTSREAVALMRGLVHGDAAQAETGLALARRRGSLPCLAAACLAAGRLSTDPRPYLHEAYELVKDLGSLHGRTIISGAMRELGIPFPRSRSQRPEFSAAEGRVIRLVSDGLTNRQIALEMRLSEKTVEGTLTRLFARTGCRSRVELAAAGLEGRLSGRPVVSAAPAVAAG